MILGTVSLPGLPPLLLVAWTDNVPSPLPFSPPSAPSLPTPPFVPLRSSFLLRLLPLALASLRAPTVLLPCCRPRLALPPLTPLPLSTMATLPATLPSFASKTKEIARTTSTAIARLPMLLVRRALLPLPATFRRRTVTLPRTCPFRSDRARAGRRGRSSVTCAPTRTRTSRRPSAWRVSRLATTGNSCSSLSLRRWPRRHCPPVPPSPRRRPSPPLAPCPSSTPRLTRCRRSRASRSVASTRPSTT
mmetsp:Transcript_3843/g.12421  ORF Transcript_3843/g.12421 Transcript_3843/m.12421 type:complete len:247 (-) Transcript_3843:978-1718(-)